MYGVASAAFRVLLLCLCLLTIPAALLILILAWRDSQLTAVSSHKTQLTRSLYVYNF
jgi:hypothetical protein